MNAPKSSRALLVVFVLAVLFSLSQLTRSWDASLLDRYEFRQLQTALTAYWIAEDGWQLAYPTPLFGPPWSIPMEFPTYQVITGAWHHLSGMPLEQSGRLVSVLMLFACLPALHDLLGLARLPHSRRLIIHALVLTAPIYLFYGRTFMIETTALCLGVWFLALLRRSLGYPSTSWIISTTAIATLAALTKVTTFVVFGLPAAVMCLAAWRQPVAEYSRARIGFAAIVPALISLGTAWRWVRFSDGVKDSNPFSGFLTARELQGWNFGSWSLRGDWSFWLHLQETVASHNLAEGTFAVALLCLPFASSRARWIAGVAAAGFLAGPLVFANLYHLHDYYYAANALLLLSAAGLLLGSAWDNPRLPRGFSWLALGLMLSCQSYAYYRGYASHHRHPAPSPPALVNIIKERVPKDGVVLIYGADWNPLLPYYAERRAVMVPGERQNETTVLEDIIAKMEPDNPAVPFSAMIVHGAKLRTDQTFIHERATRFGSSPTPSASDEENALFLPAVHSPAPFPDDLEAEALPRDTTVLFKPNPIAARSRYGLSAFMLGEQIVLNAHAPTELIFEVPDGAREAVAVTGLQDAATDITESAISDGITFEALQQHRDGTLSLLKSKYINPAATPGDRGPQTIVVPLPEPFFGKLILRLHNGPNHDPASDWSYWQSVEIN